MSQEIKKNVAQDNPERQRQHVKRKQETHSRLQCWISNRHAERLQELGMHLEDSQASLIEQAIEGELAALLATFAAEKLADGRARLVRHGSLPEREVLTVPAEAIVELVAQPERAERIARKRVRASLRPNRRNRPQALARSAASSCAGCA